MIIPAPMSEHETNNRLELRVTELNGMSIVPPPFIAPMPYSPPPPDTLQVDSLLMPATPDTIAINPLDTLPALQFKLLIGPYKQVDNNLYYTFAEGKHANGYAKYRQGHVICTGSLQNHCRSRAIPTICQEAARKHSH